MRPFATFNGVPFRRFTLEQHHDPIDITQGGFLGAPADTVRKYIPGRMTTSATFERSERVGLLRTEAAGCSAVIQVRPSGRLMYVVTGHEAGQEYVMLPVASRAAP